MFKIFGLTLLIGLNIQASTPKNILEDIFFGGSLDYDAKYPLYTSDKAKFTHLEVDKSLDKVFSSNLPVLLFIHGRGSEPKKSLVGGTFVEGAAVQKLEAQYKVKVLMFNWNSKAAGIYDRSEPLKNMPEAAASLKKVLTQIKNYLEKSENQNKKLTLLAHSMGSIVLQTLVQQEAWPSAQPIFNQVLITSPDADNVKHWEWLNEISQIENVYVSINQDDDILEKSTDSREEGRKALGLKPVIPYSTNATYLDLTKLGDSINDATGVHEIFNKEKMKNQAYLCNIFDQLITGQKPELSEATSVTENNNYLKIKFKTSENEKCFKF